MTGYLAETGIAPIAALGYAKIAGWVANIALTGWTISALWPSGDPGGELEEEADPQALAECMGALGQGTPLSPSSRAYYLGQLDNWRTRGAAELEGQAVALAAFDKTIANLRELFEAEDDGAGRPVGLCHVSAGIQILEAQLEALTGGTGAGMLDELTPPTELYAGSVAARWPVIAGIGALAALLLWRFSQ